MVRGDYDNEMFLTDPVLPVDPEGLEVLHDREYRVRSFCVAPDRLLVRGAVRDQKPPGLFVEGDPDPLVVHHMVVDLHVGFPAMVITAAEVVFETHPHETCPAIVDAYQGLVGLSIARGFSHKVRELFGGPRGCTHTTALLLAMGPVAIQSAWSMRVLAARRAGSTTPGAQSPTPTGSAPAWRSNMDTCHVWAADGEYVRDLETGAPVSLPLPIERRLVALGHPHHRWTSPPS